jgi:transcriptional regulator with XRE-family HTH domain
VRVVNPKRIILAREARGINQSELAEKLGLNKGSLSRIETGEKTLSKDNLAKISAVTGFPESFFFAEGDIIAENLSFRKRETVAQTFIMPITAKSNIVRQHVQFLAEQLGKPQEQLPAIEVSDEVIPAIIAKEVRKKWRHLKCH